MKVLFTNGDSWTQGDSPAQNLNWEATKTLPWYDIIPSFGDEGLTYEKETRIRYKFYDSEVWPKTLGRHLGLTTWNAGRLGADNYSIFRRTINSIEWLEQNGVRDIFVVIGWTSMLRIPVFAQPENDPKNLYLHQVRPKHSHLTDKLFYRRSYYFEDLYMLLILSMQNYLNSKNIDYLFFNAFDKYEKYRSNKYVHLLDMSKWMNGTMDEAHFMDYILAKYNLPNWGKSDYFITAHPRDNAHQAWGDHLYRYIQDNNLL